jgi:colanic acid biosynthesis glycosyl transferase WcaI
VMKPHSWSVRLLEWGVRRLLRRADDIIVLDRYMAERVSAKENVGGKVVVIPPWPLEDHPGALPHAENRFRRAHGIDDRFVVMYSGNHTPANPIDTLIAAAGVLRAEPRLLFAFVGGGSDKIKVERAGLPNVLSLPYQPLADLRYSLSAADLHVVTMGDAVVGIVHPCKVYGAMAVARPVLAFGPDECHVADLMRSHGIGWHVRHGDVAGAVSAIREAMAAPSHILDAMGGRGLTLIRNGLGKDVLCARFCDILERRVASLAA